MNDMAYPYIYQEEAETPAISIDEIKKYLKLNQYNVAVDEELKLLCNTALAYAEKYSRQFFVEKSVTTSRCFWGEMRNGIFSRSFTLRRCPLVSVESIKYDDDKELPAENYKVIKKAGNYGQIILCGNLPELETEWMPIEIKFVAGYEKLPNDIKLAMLQHIASMWMNRGDCDNDTYNKCPKISKDIYKKYKIMEVGV